MSYTVFYKKLSSETSTQFLSVLSTLFLGGFLSGCDKRIFLYENVEFLMHLESAWVLGFENLTFRHMEPPFQMTLDPSLLIINRFDTRIDWKIMGTCLKIMGTCLKIMGWNFEKKSMGCNFEGENFGSIFQKVLCWQNSIWTLSHPVTCNLKNWI